MLGLVVADLELDCLPTAVGGLNQVLIDIFVNSLGLRIASDGNAGRPSRPPVMVGEIVLHRWEGSDHARRNLRQRAPAKGREKNNHDQPDAHHLGDSHISHLSKWLTSCVYSKGAGCPCDLLA